MTSQPSYFALSSKDRVDALEAAASTLGRPADLLEKDIWVVWALDALFSSRIGEHLVFKGGTSLSKAYKAIDRFSEDVDLTYDIRQIIPDLIEDPDNPYPPNRSQAKKWTETVRARLSDWVKAEPFDILFEEINAAGVAATLSNKDGELYLEYEAVRSGDGYVRPAVLLEFGARSTGETGRTSLDLVRYQRCPPRAWSTDRLSARHACRTNLLGEGHGHPRLLLKRHIPGWLSLCASLVRS